MMMRRRRRKTLINKQYRRSEAMKKRKIWATKKQGQKGLDKDAM
jgi:hypothetical protein